MADPVRDIGIKADEAEVAENIDPKDALKGRKVLAKNFLVLTLCVWRQEMYRISKAMMLR